MALYSAVIDRERSISCENFVSTLIDVTLTKSQATDEYERSKADGSTMEKIQGNCIKTHYFSDKCELPAKKQLDMRLDSIYADKSKGLYNGVVSIDLVNFDGINKQLSSDTADEVVYEIGNKYHEIAMQYNDRMKLCAPYHCSGGEFAFVCQFTDENVFKNLVKQLSHVRAERTYRDKLGTEYGVKCYSRVGGVYATCESSDINDGFEQAKKVENRCKRKIAKAVLGYNDYDELKRRSNCKGKGEGIVIQDKDLDCLWLCDKV